MSPRKRKADAGAQAKAKAKAFPGKIGWSLTIAQLREEAEARGVDLSKLKKQDKHSLLNVLGEGSASVVAASISAMKRKPAKAVTKTVTAPSSKAKNVPTAATKASNNNHKSSSPLKATKKSRKNPPGHASIAAFIVPQPAYASAPKPAATATPAPKAKLPDNAASAVTSKNSITVPSKDKNPTEDYPRISSKCTLAQLKEEVVARQLDPKKVPKLKADLLHHLVEGSIHVKETEPYKQYQSLLAVVEMEKSTLYAKALQNRASREARKEALQKERYAKEERKRQEELIKQQQIREKEMAAQRSLHTHLFPQVHRHSLAKTNALKQHGEIRHARCDLCDNRRSPSGFLILSFEAPNSAIYTCEECDWDICQECFQSENKSDAEKKAARRREQDERRRQLQLRREEEERQAEEERNRWDARKRFLAKTIKPPSKNKKVSPSLKFTVWCSDGYDTDGWHSYDGPPNKEFDTCWATKKEANQRAEYLFFWKNPWGLAPNEIADDDGDPSPTAEDGLNEWTVAPPDSSRWTVGVVPAVAYRHLENASQQRHNYDDELEPKGYEELSYCL